MSDRPAPRSLSKTARRSLPFPLVFLLVLAVPAVVTMGWQGLLLAALIWLVWIMVRIRYAVVLESADRDFERMRTEELARRRATEKRDARLEGPVGVPKRRA